LQDKNRKPDNNKSKKGRIKFVLLKIHIKKRLLNKAYEAIYKIESFVSFLAFLRQRGYKLTMQLTKYLGYLGLLASVLVGSGEYLLHYSDQVIDHGANCEFLKTIY